jgi:LPXTG-motif cell wall-anchored protein
VSNNGVAGNGATDPDGGPTTPTTPTGPGTTPTTPTTPTDPGTTPPTTTPTGTDPGTNPGRTSLPKTGSELEAEALIGAMLLLAGFGFRRAGKRLS